MGRWMCLRGEESSLCEEEYRDADGGVLRLIQRRWDWRDDTQKAADVNMEV